MTDKSDDELLALAVKARDCYGGGAPWERYFAAVKDPAAIIAMVERHRAEVADLIAKMDWNASLWDAAQKSADTLRAEVERLMRERDGARAGYAAEIDAHHATELALAAAQKRVGELEKALEEIASNTTSLGDALDTACNAIARPKEIDNGP